MTLIVDNYDSFTFNLLHAVEAFDQVTVWRNDAFDLAEVQAFDRIILSPGPALPKDSGLLMSLIEAYRGSKRMLGVCLGFQAMVEQEKGRLTNLDEVHHGQAITLQVDDPNDPLFRGLSDPVQVGLYHSWGVRTEDLPADFQLTASWEGLAMAVRHRIYPWHGVQFHPESILSVQGKTMLAQWMALPV